MMRRVCRLLRFASVGRRAGAYYFACYICGFPRRTLPGNLVATNHLLPRTPAYDLTLPKVPTRGTLAVRQLLLVKRFCAFWRETVTALGDGDLLPTQRDYNYGVLAPRTVVAAPEARF